MRTIFITYNPDSAFEQTLAIRLHTIGASNGFLMYLPDRYNSSTVLDDETKSRISKADYVVMFSISPLSKIVKQEIEFAFKRLNDKSKIIVVYDKEKGKNLKGDVVNHFSPIYMDKYNGNPDEALHDILKTIRGKEVNSKIKNDKENSQALLALMGIGLGLLILGAATKK
jgi:hypothetical protein